MKSYSSLTILVLVLLLSSMSMASTRFNHPESIIRIPGEPAILVANVGTGTITKVSLQDNANSIWAKGLKGPKGMAILNGKLYVADETEIKCLDLSDGKLLNTYPVPGSSFLNDSCTDGKFIYVTDTETNELIKFNPETGEVTEFVTEGLAQPNGICYDKKQNRLLMNSFRTNSPIQVIDLETGAVSVLLETDTSKLDGIALTSDNYLLFSSWSTGAIYSYDLDKSKMRVLKNGFSGPADFWMDEEAGKIYLPVMKEDRIDIIRFDP